VPTHTVDLTHRQAALVEELVRSGRYQTASDVLRDGLRILGKQHHEDAAKLDALRAAVLVGVAALERGDYKEFGSADDLATHLNEVADLALSGTDLQH